MNIDNTSEIILPNGKQAKEVIGPDGSTIWQKEPAIPDSEANQKLVHRWILSDDGGVLDVSDSVGSANGTNNGVSVTTGDWADAAAGDGDGVDDYIETTTWGDFGSNMGSGFAIAWSLVSTDDDAHFFGTRTDGGDRVEANIGGFGAPSDALGFILEDTNGNEERIHSDENVNDGSQKRIVWNVPEPDPDEWEVYINQSSVAYTVDESSGASSFNDFGEAVALFARNLEGSVESHINTVIDDFCVYGDDLSQSEAESYNNPWD